jgi:flagellar biosynthetic protein FlhB
LADDSDLEKTESASPRRLEKAREDGDVPRSRELGTFSVLAAATLSFWLWGESIHLQLKKTLTLGLTFDQGFLRDPGKWMEKMGQQLIELALTCTPAAALIMIAALISPLLIGGWLFHGGALAPNFGKLNPIQGLSNMFSKNALVELGKAVGKTLVVGLVAWYAIRLNQDSVFQLIFQTIDTGSASQGTILLMCFTFLVLSLTLIALIDAPYQMWSYSQKLMMTRQELKDEAKESEGNPEIKAKIRSQQREMARRRMMSNVPTADVVITNPTHYAVALKYPENANTAPLVVAKGLDELAERIKAMARENNVLVMEAPPLARALYSHTELDQEIPKALYTAVAQVLAYVYQLRAFRKHEAIAPEMPENITVPAGMDPLLTNKTEALA